MPEWIWLQASDKLFFIARLEVKITPGEHEATYLRVYVVFLFPAACIGRIVFAACGRKCHVPLSSSPLDLYFHNMCTGIKQISRKVLRKAREKLRTFCDRLLV